MAQDEFSVNELEPVRNNDEPNNIDSKVEEVQQINTNQEEYDPSEYEGPTIKEVLINTINNPDYQGPTAKEIVVNSVKVDNTKKKNMVGLVVLMLVIALVGTIIGIDMLSEDKQHETNYLNDLPDWSLKYHEYISKKYKDIVSYELVFLDLDFDDKAEAIISYKDNNKIVYDVFDVLGSKNINFRVEDMSDLLMMYSFTDKNVSWYINTSVNDNDMNLIDVKKRIVNGVDYDINLSLDTLAEFKSDHFTLSYDVLYTEMSFRTYDRDFSLAVKSYLEEYEDVNEMANSVKDEYDDTL